MALRVWLPLNGSVENKGISGTIMSGSPASWGNGKIGKCATFAGNAGNVIYNNTTDYNYTDKFSWTIWINTNYTGTTAQYAFTNGRADAGGYGYGLQCSNTTTCNIRFGNQSFGVAVSGGEWTHLAFTKSGTSIKVYKNGSIVTDTTFTGTLPTYSDGNGLGLGCFHYSGNIYPFYGSLNDFRIYDHCLSAKEVKEISQGLVLHYKLDGLSGGAGENLLSKYVTPGQQNPGATSSAGRTNYYGDYGIIIPASENADTYFRLFTNIQLQQNVQYTISCEASGLSSGTYYNFPLYAQNNTSMGVLRIDRNGICSLTFTMTYATQTAMTVDGKTVYLCFMDDSARTLADGQGTITIKNFKLEKGSKATPWSPAQEDLDIDTTKIIDSSGYGNDGTIIGTLTTQQDAERYGVSTAFAASSAVNCGRGAMVTDSITVNIWSKYSTYSNLVSCTEGGGWNFENNSGLTFPIYISSVGYVHIDAASRPAVADYANSWHMFTGTYDRIKQLTSLYIDGELIGTGSVSAPNQIQYHSSNVIWINAEAGSGETASYGNAKSFSDFRIYATALSAEDILDLYHTSANIDNEKRLHSFEFVEDDGNRVDEQGLVHSGLLSSDSDLIKLLYDKKLHIEPDGSVWAHIYHHNRPDLGSFSSTNDFANSVKIDDNRWFNATEIVNSFSSEWEFLIIYNFTQGGTVYKERWIQTKNPETAVFGDVDAADITRVTGSEYKTGTWGGLYKKNSSAYWVMNNGTNGNWWGATGSFSIYQGGIPGYGGSITTTGCNDLYIRIDRFSSTPTHASIGRGSVYIFNDFIEK